MSREAPDNWAYVEKMLEDTRRYARELLQEHEKLRVHAFDLEAQRARLEDELQAARHEVVRLSERNVEVERQNSHLTLLCGASYRLLQGTLDRQEVLARIREVVADVVGSEELAVFNVVPGGDALRLEQAFGTGTTFPEIPLGTGLIGRSVQEREIYVAGRSGGAPLAYEADLQACIPLLLEGRPTGALAIFRLLPQKPALEAHDLDVFEVLANQVPLALHCAVLQARVADRLES